MRARIAVVEDDPDIQRLLGHTLEKAGLEAAAFSAGRPFLAGLEALRPDAVILDLMLPDLDGLEICRRLRQDPAMASVPILMLTARGEETDKVVGLELGADDYMTKPFSTRELTARIRALLRRAASPPPVGQPLRVGTDLAIFPDTFQVTVAGQSVELTAAEFKLLLTLAEAAGRVLTRDQLLNRLWGGDRMVLDRTIDVHIKHLRDKLGPAGRLVKSVRGVGYKIES